MSKKLLFVIIILLVIAGIVLVIIGNRSNQKNKSNNPEDGIVLFYSPTCPHCIKVEEFLTQNKVTEKIKFENRDTSIAVNLELLKEKAGECGLNESDLAIPFLFDGSSKNPSCLIGDVDIIKFFQGKL
ncbi:MAG: glutaredoxin domain-containing protein [Patescibacteria group bacterium]|nr:glutaredoxin domain-containing protein [Patescibacteria group bacterium]